MQRYFGAVKQGQVSLCEDDIFHLTRVMRAKPGTEIEVVADGKVLLCKTTCFNPLKIEIVREIEETSELPNKIILLASLVKGEKMDLVLQKATELGVDEIVLVETSRTVVKIKNEEKAAKLERFNKILKEAAEQSRRCKIPTLDHIIKYEGIKEIEADVKMIAYEGEEGSSSSFRKQVEAIKPKQSVAILIGPEGGFDQKEVNYALDLGYNKISLGRRILRAETAAFYALSVIGNYLERKWLN